jgi:hypothetical protein
MSAVSSSSGLSGSMGPSGTGGPGIPPGMSGSKRGLVEFLMGDANPPSTAVQDLFTQSSELFESGDKTGEIAGVVAQLFDTVSRKQAVDDHKLILIPVEQPITWKSFLHGVLAVFAVKVDLPCASGGLVLKFIGTTGGGQDNSTFPDEIRMVDVPDHLVTMKPSANGVPTELEKFVQVVLDSSPRAGAFSTRGPATTGGSSLNGSDVVKKFAGCRIQDLNGDAHDLLNKEGAAKRGEQLSVLIREMLPTRREILCPDLSFSVNLFWSECLRHVERKPDTQDPLYSITGMRDLVHLPAVRDKALLQHHLLEGHSADNWVRSLWDFVEGDEGWDKGIDVRGKRNLLRAFEAWVTFQSVFKGSQFQVVLAPVTALFRDHDRTLDEYGAEYVWTRLEIMIRAYRYEVVTTRGRVTKQHGLHPIVNQADCVKFLQVLVSELVADARGGKWEAYPHQRFYAPGAQYSMLQLPGRGNESRHRGDNSSVTAPNGLDSKQTDKAHKHGLCMWYLAGALKMVNKTTNTQFKCRDESKQHTALKNVPFATVQELLKDPEFMTCRIGVIKKELIKKVGEKQQLFGK